MDRSTILLTRLLPPRLPAGGLRRDVLAGAIARGMDGRLVTVLAGAGYGKSTAVALAIARRPGPTVWVSCDERIGGGPDLLAHVAAGIERAVPGFGTRLRFEGDARFQLVALCNELVATLADDLVLVLDDVHLLDAEAAGAVGQMTRDLPDSVHLMLIGRAPLGFGLGRLRAGRLLEVTAADLALSEEEVAELWTAAGNPADEAAAARLRESTEGWVTGVALASRAGLAGLDRPGDSGQFAYLAEEVLAAEGSRVQDFIQRTAVLERFSPALAAHVTGDPDARALCRELVRRHLFVIPLDSAGEWYRYHHLFLAFLRARLRDGGPELEREMHRRAAAACATEGLEVEAVDHLLAAGEEVRAADLIDALADRMRLTSQALILSRWIAALPEGLRAGRPSLALAHAISTFTDGDPEGGFAVVEPAIEDFLSAGDHERAAAGFFTMIYAQLASGTRQANAIDVGLRQLPKVAEDAPLLPACMVLMASELGCAARYAEAEEMLGRVLKLKTPGIDPLGPGYLASARALFLDHARGRSKQALRTMDWVIELFERNERYDGLAYVLALRFYRAILLNRLGDYGEALAEVDRCVATAGRRGVTGGADRIVTKLRAVALAGLERWDELEEVLARGEPVDQMRGASYGFRTRAPAARLAAHRGDREAVAHHAAAVLEYVDAFGFSFDAPGWICDVAVAAWQVGLADDARRLYGHVIDGARRAEDPWARARGQLLGSSILADERRAEALADALALTAEWDLEEIWTRRDRALAAGPLATAMRQGIGPPGLAARLAVRCGGEVLERCAEALLTAPAPVRGALLDALDAAGVVDPEISERLAGPGAPAPHPRGGAPPVARPALRIAGLGGFAVRRGEEVVPVSAFGRERARAVLAALVCAGGPVHREQLLDWLWPALSPDRALRALHVTVHALRRALEPELGRGGATRSVVRAEGEGYRLVLAEGDAVDVAEFTALLAAPPGETPHDALRRLLAAERVHAGRLYPEWPYSEWAAERRREVERGHALMLEQLADRLAAAGRPGEAISRVERLVAIEPGREASHRRLMLLYAHAGEKALALRQYHACRTVLRRELGVEASGETRALYQAILEDRPVPGLEVRAVA